MSPPMCPQGNGNPNKNAGNSNANSGNNLNYQNYASNNNSGNNSNDNEKCTGARKLTPEEKRRKQQLKRFEEYLKKLKKTGYRNENKWYKMGEGIPVVRSTHFRKGHLPSQLASGSGILSPKEFMCAAPKREYNKLLPQQGCQTFANFLEQQKRIEGQKAIAEINRRNKERQNKENERKKQIRREIAEKRRQQQQSGCKHEANAGSEKRQSRPTTNTNNRYKHEGQERLAILLSQGNPSSKIPKMWGAMSLSSTGGFKLGTYIHTRGPGRRQCTLPSPGNAAAAAPVPRNAAANKKATAAAAANKKAAAANKKAASSTCQYLFKRGERKNKMCGVKVKKGNRCAAHKGK